MNPPAFYSRLAVEPKKLFWVRAKGHIGNVLDITGSDLTNSVMHCDALPQMHHNEI